jgi:hypothetical protein
VAAWDFSSAKAKDEGRKVFFFEKKKQKTFAYGRALARQRAQRDKSFLLLFFKKEESSPFYRNTFKASADAASQ